MKVLKYTDKLLLFTSILLFLFGLIMIFSASNVAAFMRYQASPYRFLERQSLFLLIGIVITMIMINVSTKVYNIGSWPAMLFIGGALIAVLFYSSVINEAKSWIPIGPFMFQPSEFAKVITIVWMASFYEIKRKKMGNLFTSFFPLMIVAIFALLIMKQNDYGTAILYLAIVFLLFCLIPLDLRMKLKSLGILGGCALLFVFVVFVIGGKEINLDRQIGRLSFTNPCSEEKFYDSGNQVCNSYIAFNNGGLLGEGLGDSMQKYLYLPESHTDFIFAIIIEECGLIAGIVVLLALFLILARIVIIGKRSNSSRGSIMCYGIAIYIFLHIVVNLCGIMGLFPITGVPLPFMSYGGSFTLCLIAALAIVQRVCIETKLNTKLRKKNV